MNIFDETADLLVRALAVHACVTTARAEMETVSVAVRNRFAAKFVILETHAGRAITKIEDDGPDGDGPNVLAVTDLELEVQMVVTRFWADAADERLAACGFDPDMVLSDMSAETAAGAVGRVRWNRDRLVELRGTIAGAGEPTWVTLRNVVATTIGDLNRALEAFDSGRMVPHRFSLEELEYMDLFVDSMVADADAWIAEAAATIGDWETALASVVASSDLEP